MSEQNRHHEELEALLAGVVEGELSAEQTKRLEALLHDDPTQREFYVRFMITHALLRWSHAGVGSNAKKETAAAGQTSALPASALPITDQPILDAGTIPTIPGAAPTSIGHRWLGRKRVFLSGHFWVFAALSRHVRGRIATVLHGRPAAPGNPTDVAVQPEISVNPAVVKAEIAAVAKMTAGENCQWGDSTPGLRIGDGISIGQSLNLVSGVAEFTFDIGARVIVQSPASFSVDSSKSIRMQSGKLTAEITKAQARGFEVLTPEATFVDQGTEFGVEVAPGGSSRVHVFKGEVDLALSNKSGTALPTHRLLANSGARLEADASHVTLVEDTGESFVRSMDQAGRDLHTVAYWRFEDHPVGTLLPDTKFEYVGHTGHGRFVVQRQRFVYVFPFHSARVFRRRALGHGAANGLSRTARALITPSFPGRFRRAMFTRIRRSATPRRSISSGSVPRSGRSKLR